MPGTVKKTISLPKKLAQEVEERARAEGKTVSAVIEEALRKAHAPWAWDEFKAVQGCWAAKAKEKGILTERDLTRLLRI